MPPLLPEIAEHTSLDPRNEALQSTSSSCEVARILAGTMALLPILGVPSQLVLQDTLKSAVLSLGVLLAALAFFWQQRRDKMPLRWHGLMWLPLALLAYSLGSMAWSHTFLAGVEAVRWFILALLLWLGLNTLNQATIPTLLWGIHAGAVGASAWAALQYWWGLDWFPQAAFPASTFINRNFFAEYAVSALPFSILLLANFRISKWLYPLALSVALNIVVILLTGTRSALLALLFLLPSMAWALLKFRKVCTFWHWPRKTRLQVSSTLILGVLLIGNLPTQSPLALQEGYGLSMLQRSYSRASSMANPDEYTQGSFSQRAVMWKATLRMTSEHPWTGVGAGAWEVEIPRYEEGEWQFDYYPHNEYLQLLSEYGVVVGGLFLAFLFAILLMSASSTRQLPANNIWAPVRALSLCSLLGLLIVSNAGFPWHLAGSCALLAIGLSILAATDGHLRPEQTALSTYVWRWRTWYGGAGTFLATCGIVCAIGITHQAVQAERKIVQGLLDVTRMALKVLEGDTSTPPNKQEVLQEIREGIAINPHYRKLTPIIGDQFAAMGDLENAVWIWASVAASRPNIAVLWSNLAKGYSRLGQHEKAMAAFQHLKQLQPTAPSLRALELILMANAGQTAAAVQLLNAYFDKHSYDYDLIDTSMAIAVKSHDEALALRTLRILEETWPDMAAEGWLKIGNLYLNSVPPQKGQALAAFKSGLQSSPPTLHSAYLEQVPAPYRDQLQ